MKILSLVDGVKITRFKAKLSSDEPAYQVGLAKNTATQPSLAGVWAVLGKNIKKVFTLF